ncbi:MAG: NADH-quinone oxidoreductase subunit J [Roseivirga sp.]
MTLATIILYCFVGLTLISALYIAITKNVLYAAFALMLTFLGVAGVFMLIGAGFIAISQILVYVGGILVLIVFGVMLTNRLKGQQVTSPSYNKPLGLLVSGGLLFIFYKAIIEANFGAIKWIESAQLQSPKLESFGMKLMTDYVLAFEVIGILLLLALIGAVKIAAGARKEADNAH